MIAALPWYDAPHHRALNDALWAEIRARLPFEAPKSLSRGGDTRAEWLDPALVLSQTCSMPYAALLHGRAHLVGAPDFGLTGCSPGMYHSTIVTRARFGDIKNARLAYNDAMSQSGYKAAEGYSVIPHLETGAHALSLEAVARGDADVAFIDSQTLRVVGLAEELEEQGTTPPTPACPYITSRPEWVAPVRDAMNAALKALPEETRRTLGIRAVVPVDAAAYLAHHATVAA